MSASGKKAVIVGGSIAGLHAARLLAQRGWDVSVYERVASDLRSRGAGIAMHPETFADLRFAGIDIGPEIGISSRRRRTLDRDGNFVHDVTRPQVFTSWANLYILLRERLDGIALHSGTALVGLDDDGSGVTATFDDGSQARCDILIGADGLRSTVRHLIEPEAKPLYSGFIAWRGLAEEARLSKRTLERVFEEFCFCMPPGEQMAGYPVRETAPTGASARRAFNFIWYRPVADAGLDRFMTDSTGARHDVNVPPPLVNPQIVAEMRADAEWLLSAEFVDIVAAVDQPFYQPIFDMTVKSMIRGRVALIGDAAFVARPHVGAGVTKAFDDGQALAQCLDGAGIDEGLARFNALRQPIGVRVVERARELGGIMSSAEIDDNVRTLEVMLGSATMDYLYKEQV
jgi:2-polyprenyl-6-methoxyphenol hydroxylase-like FAD-dependent oxidoreductase